VGRHPRHAGHVCHPRHGGHVAVGRTGLRVRGRAGGAPLAIADDQLALHARLAVAGDRAVKDVRAGLVQLDRPFGQLARPAVERASIQPMPSDAARPKTAKMPATLWLITGPYSSPGGDVSTVGVPAVMRVLPSVDWPVASRFSRPAAHWQWPYFRSRRSVTHQ